MPRLSLHASPSKKEAVKTVETQKEKRSLGEVEGSENEPSAKRMKHVDTTVISEDAREVWIYIARPFVRLAAMLTVLIEEGRGCRAGRCEALGTISNRAICSRVSI